MTAFCVANLAHHDLSDSAQLAEAITHAHEVPAPSVTTHAGAAALFAHGRYFTEECPDEFDVLVWPKGDPRNMRRVHITAEFRAQAHDTYQVAFDVTEWAPPRAS